MEEQNTELTAEQLANVPVKGGLLSDDQWSDAFASPLQATMLEHDETDTREVEPVLKRMLDGQTREQVREWLLSKDVKPGKANKLIAASSVEMAARSLSLGFSPAEVKRMLSVKLGITIRACDPIVRKAQENLAESLDMSPAQMKAWVASLYMKLFRDKKQSGHVKIKALDSFARLYGLNAATGIDLNLKTGLTIHEIVEIVEKEQRTLVVEGDVIEQIVQDALDNTSPGDSDQMTSSDIEAEWESDDEHD